MPKSNSSSNHSAAAATAVGAKWESLPWSRVQVNKDSSTNDNDDSNDASNEFDDTLDDSKYLTAKNHYDNPKANPSDLYDVTNYKKGIDYMEGANDPGIFLGLEVIDGSQYSIEKTPIRNQVTQLDTGGFVTRLVVKDAVREGIKEEAKDKSKMKGKKKGKGKKNNDDDNDDDDDSPKQPRDPTTMSRKEKNWLKLKTIKAKRKEISLLKKRKRQEANAQGDSSNGDQGHGDDAHADTNGSQSKSQKEADQEQEPQKKKGQEKKSSSSGNATNKGLENTTTPVTREEMESVRVPWSIATGGVYLHPNLCQSLFRLGFTSPTPIQSSTLAASILGQRDVVGAAPTGSGKTLSYLLPILHALLTEQDELNEPITQYPLTALILCPTRELAMQVSMEFSKLIQATSDITLKSLIRCGTIVGGLSEQKQKRVLDVKRPPVLVGTPGRLWDLMSSGEHSHLANLKQLRFLVIDEADRMVSQGNFPQLERIFDKIQQANPSLEYMQAHAEEEYESDSDDEDRLQSLPGIRGEAKVQMLDDEILKMIDRQSKGRNIHVENDDERSNSNSDPDQDKELPRPVEIDDEEYEAQQAALLELDNVDEDIESDSEDDTTTSVKRQTFVFSATLTLPTSSHQTIDSQFQQKKGRKFGKLSIDGAIAEILEKVGAQGQTKIVDLSTTAKSELNKPKKGNESTKIVKEPTNKPTVKLPPGLSLYEIRCTQRHKDSHLYSFLANTKQGSSGPCLVFCNSIGAVKRVGETLKILGLPVRMLHAQMQQKARLSSLESLSKSNHRSVVVATDVAARGLDIPSVASVVHYDVARAVDTFVHRAGRTARGMGEKAIGWSVSLVSAAEERNHHTICKAVQGDSGSFDIAPIDSRLLSSAQERVNLASKIFVCEDTESRTNKSNQWFINASNDAGLELDTDLLDDGQLAGSRKDRQQYLEAKRARNELKMLLAKPMRKQAFGKFLSNAGLRDAIQTEQDIKPYIVHETGPSKKRRKKQNTE